MNVRTPDSALRIKSVKPIKTRRRRKPPRRNLRPILLIFIAIGLISLLIHQLTSNFFPVREISVTGCQSLSEQEVIELLNIEVGNDSILNVSIPDLEKRIKENLSLVKTVIVSKNTINGKLKIHLIEREAVAALVCRTINGYCYFLVDSEGVIIDKHDNIEELQNLILIIGEGLPEVELGEHLDMDNVNLALDVIEKSKLNRLYSRISAINADNPNKIFIQLRNEFVAIISAEMIEEGLRNISLVLSDKNYELPSYGDGSYLDARFKDVVYQGRG